MRPRRRREWNERDIVDSEPGDVLWFGLAGLWGSSRTLYTRSCSATWSDKTRKVVRSRREQLWGMRPKKVLIIIAEKNSNITANAKTITSKAMSGAER